MLALILALTLTYANAADSPEEIESITRERASRHTTTIDRVKNINYLKAKLLSVQNALKSTRERGEHLKAECGTRRSSPALEDCLSKTDFLMSDLLMHIADVQNVITSQQFQTVAAHPDVARMRIDQTLSSAIEKLRQELVSAKALQTILAEAAVKVRIAKQLEIIGKSSQEARKAAECKSASFRFSRRLRDAQTQRLLADVRSDGHLLVTAQDNASRIGAEIDSVMKACGSQTDVARLKPQVEEITTHYTEDVSRARELALAACPQVPSEELKQACAKGNINRYVLFAIHMFLQKKAGRQ